MTETLHAIGIAEIIFWLSLAAVFYAYFGYPALLFLLSGLTRREIRAGNRDYTPTVSLLIPVHNEEAVIERKLSNTFSIDYPAERLEVIIVSDGSTDRTKEIVGRNLSGRMRFLELPTRSGKAAALNYGLKSATGEIVVFSDSSIMLDKNAIRSIVLKFQDPAVGCVSGEDHIEGPGGEGLYGRYELFLRNLESRVHSIVGASGSFYAERREACEPFREGLAPDFLSVLNIVDKGYRAVTEPAAFGTMTSVTGVKDEFRRKARTLVRGMAALFSNARLMNPLRTGVFSLELLSHKVARWLVPFFMVSLLVSNAFLLRNLPYAVFLALQASFYALAGLAFFRIGGLHERTPGRVPLYFTAVNAAILYAWLLYATGIRMEIWNPSKRQA